MGTHIKEAKELSEKLESRYQSTHPPVFIKTLPWLPQVLIVDAMFLVNTRPLRRTKTIEEYAILLFNRFILEHYKAGVRGVHLIFDKPSKQAFNPKQFEHAKRYLSKKTSCQHEHISFSSHTSIPQGWHEYIECRTCKQSVVEVIGLSYLVKGSMLLKADQRLIIAGCYSGENGNDAWIIHSNAMTPEIATEYHTNAVEADSRIWRHAIQSQETHIPQIQMFTILA